MDGAQKIKEKSQNRRAECRWESGKRRWVREAKKVGGWLATRATPGPRSTNIRVGGIYSYKLSAGALYESARAGGDLSPLKGLRFCRTSLPTLLFTLSPAPSTTPYLYLVLAPRHPPSLVSFSAPFSHAPSCTVSLARPPDWKDESFASNKLPHEPTSS